MNRATPIALHGRDGTIRVELADGRAREPETVAALSALSGGGTVAQLLRALRAYCSEHELTLRVVDADVGGRGTAYVVVR